MTAPTDEPIGIEVDRAIWTVIDASLDAACTPIAAGHPLAPDGDVRLETEHRRNGRTVLVITALPVQLDPSVLMETVASEVRDGTVTVDLSRAQWQFVDRGLDRDWPARGRLGATGPRPDRECHSHRAVGRGPRPRAAAARAYRARARLARDRLRAT
jgi:hypothetical protein